MITVDRGPVWTVTLDRPERANALSSELVEALHSVLDENESAPLVLRGNSRHFAAGFDLGGLAAETDASLAYRFLRIGLLLERVIAAPYPTTAVVEGAAVGAGADLVLACAERIVDPSVTLRFPGSAFGVVLGAHRREELAADLPHDSDAALAALARSVTVPGLRDRIAAYAEKTLTKENA